MKGMSWVRVWLPAAIVAAGAIAVVASGFSETGLEGGFALIGAGLAVWLLNFFFRLGVAGDRERDAEDRARRFYDEHGFWPDEPPPDPPPPERPHRRPLSPRPTPTHGRRRRR